MPDLKDRIMKVMMNKLGSPHTEVAQCSPPTQAFLSDMADVAIEFITKEKSDVQIPR